MNKQWYINQDGKNKGPFSAHELLNLADKGELKSFSLCFKKGMNSWVPFFEAKLLLEAQTLPPVLPDIPELPPLPSPELELPSLPFELEAEEVETEVDILDDALIEYEDLDEVEEDEIETEEHDDLVQKKPFPIYTFSFGVVLSLLFVIFSFVVLVPANSRPVLFNNVSMDVLDQLQAKQQDSKFYVNLGLDKSSEVIYGSSNLSSHASVRAEFKRISVDSFTDKISFHSSATLKEGVVKFDDFDFLEGERIVQGLYHVRFLARVMDPWHKIKNYIFKRPNEFYFENDSYLIPASLNEYKKQIESIQSNKKIHEKEILISLDQKLQTVDSILTSLSLHYRLSLNFNTGSECRKEFEKRYQMQAGPLLQSIILEDYEKLYATSVQRAVLQEISENIHGVAKDIAAMSSELSTEISKYARVTSKIRLAKREALTVYIDEHKEKIQGIRNSIKLQLEEVKAEI